MQTSQLNTKKLFDEILLRALDSALINALGESAAKAVKFYVDTSVIIKDPQVFEELLMKLFSGSNAGSRIIEENIRDSLLRLLEERFSIKLLVGKDKDKGFRQFILDCRAKMNLELSE